MRIVNSVITVLSASIFLFLFSCVCHASAPISTGSPAGDAIEEGLYIKVGLKDSVDKFGLYTADHARRQLSKWHMEMPSAVVLACYKIYRDKAINVPLGHGAKLRLNTNSATVSLPLPF